MNYEKAYREALERAKKAKNNVSFNAQTHKVLDIIFPELKESEDERIRQRIIHALHGDVLSQEETDKAVAWLEKQKPVKDNPAFLSPDRAGDSIRLSDLPKMKPQWKRIPKDKDGLYDEEASTMYDELPIIILEEINDYGESDYDLCYIDERTWFDWEHDLNKPTYNWYFPCDKLPIEL